LIVLDVHATAEGGLKRANVGHRCGSPPDGIEEGIESLRIIKPIFRRRKGRFLE
jgi:hypothetical protein